MDSLIVTLIVGLLATPIATMVLYLTNRKKTNAESQAAIAVGATNAVEAITSVLESLREELDQTRKELTDASAKIEELRKVNEILVNENRELRQQVEKLTLLIENKNNLE
jgi:chromosome segregation ATPase